MVRPDRVELPTFWFVGMQSDRILLILMPATTHFEANTWRTTPAIDERLMKGFSRDQLSKSTFLRTPSSSRPARGSWPERRLHLEVPTHDRHGAVWSPARPFFFLMIRRPPRSTLFPYPMAQYN